MWLGDVETSTDTLVPVIENGGGPSLDDRIRSELTTAINTVENGSSTDHAGHTAATAKPRILPEVHNSCAKPKPHTNGAASAVAMDASGDAAAAAPPDQRKSDGLTNGLALPNGSLSNRRHRDSAGAKLAPLCTDLPGSSGTNDSSGSPPPPPPPATNGKCCLVANGIASQSPAIERTMTAANIIPTMTACGDGLAPALSEQNLRLLQIVHEHKVSGVSDFGAQPMPMVRMIPVGVGDQ